MIMEYATEMTRKIAGKRGINPVKFLVQICDFRSREKIMFSSSYTNTIYPWLGLG